MIEDQRDIVAAVDLGSNSFHMIVCRIQDGQLLVLDRIKEMVRLGAGVDPKTKTLSDEAQQRALDCLGRFGQRIRQLPLKNVRIVGTNTLRSASNTKSFINAAEDILNHPIEIISGIEEARLIHLGVTTSVEPSDGRRLMMDIGGGSTEYILDNNNQPVLLESLYMGCVSMSRRYFPQGDITEYALRAAYLAAQQELEHILETYNHKHWQIAIGCSGSIRAVHKVVTESGWSEHGITLDSLKKLKSKILKFRHFDELDFAGLDPERKPVFVGGFIILYATFEALGIEEMRVSDSALREGLIHDLLGRIQHKDIRYNSVMALAQRYHVDLEHSSRVEQTATEFFHQLSDSWKLDEDEHLPWLQWSCSLFEVGLDIAHSHYQKHGAYIISNTNLSGFSQQEQQLLATLVENHRRKILPETMDEVLSLWRKVTPRLIIILRLSILLHRSRTPLPLPEIRLEAKKKSICVCFPPDWLQEHKLTETDLLEEAAFLSTIDYKLIVDDC